MRLLDGKAVADQILTNLKAETSKIKDSIRLDVILIGDDFSSKKYVEMKQKRAEEVGIKVEIHKFSQNCQAKYILSLIKELNQDPKVTGILVQLPLPKNFDTNVIVNSIDWQKDVDGLSAENIGRLFQGEECLVAATPLGIMKLLEAYKINVKGANVAMIGASRLVGIPIVGLLRNAEATVTLCDIYTKDIKEISARSDIVISATGQPKLVKKDWVKKDVVVVDVGYARDPETGKICGDVDFEEVKKKAAFITPVPGGVGPMTVACLLMNTVRAKVMCCER